MDIGWTEDHCARLDEIAAEGHSYIAAAAERARRENTWVLVLNSSGPNGPMNQREDYQEAIRIKERLYQEAGHADPRLHPREQVRQRPNQPFAGHDEASECVDPKTGLAVVRHGAISKLFFLGMATVFVVAMFFMVTDIKMGRAIFFLQV